MVMPERSISNEKYRYGFNGKENDNEVKGVGAQYDYGFRIYDTRIGRFLSVDPLFQSYPWLTTYQFAENSPIQFVDIDGRESGWIDNGMGRQYMSSGDIGNVYRRPIDIKVEPKPQVKVPEHKLVQGGIQGTPEGQFTRILQTEAIKQTVPGSNLAWKNAHNESISNSDIALEALGIFPFFKMGKVVGSVSKYIGESGKLLLRGAGQYGKCVDFASDFAKKVAPSLSKEGATVTRFEINIGKDGLLGTTQSQLSDNGMHQFTEVTKDGVSMIYDNIHTSGIPKADFIKELAGDMKGKIIQGAELIKSYTKKIE